MNIITILVFAVISCIIYPFILPLVIIHHLYENYYFGSNSFFEIKNSIKTYIDNCNDLNDHINCLKETYSKLEISKSNYGNAVFVDSSKYTYKREKIKEVQDDINTYHCSRTIVNNAKQQPFKYICKYFNIKNNVETIEKLEEVLNNFIAVENGRELLQDERNSIMKSIENKIPKIIKKFSRPKLIKKLGFNDIDLSDTFYPKFIFQYTSPAGNAEYSTEIILDNDNLEYFIEYLAEQEKIKKSFQGQRQLMTKTLREKIKIRDNYTCCHCGVSINDEPHLLLEIDHIKPISKGGMTEENNLQTLCWKCNRTKSNKY